MDRGGKGMKTHGFKTQQELWEYLIGGGKITCKHGKDEHKYIHLINGITRYSNGDSAQNCILSVDYWKPYHEAEEISPESEGELWRHIDTGNYYHTFFYGVILKFQGEFLHNIDGVIHGKGYARLFPKVEDNSVETIEIEDVLWNTTENHTYPYQEESSFDWDELLNMKPIKLICVIPKEG
jgi:hypothetical protein